MVRRFRNKFRGFAPQVALLRAGKALDKLKGENEDQKHGIEMVKKALSWPARQIAINAGEDGSVE